jgi:hypothetical protein
VFQAEFKSKKKTPRLRKLVLIGQYMRRVLCGWLRKRYAMCSHFDVSLGCFDIVAVDGKHVNQSSACCVPSLEAHQAQREVVAARDEQGSRCGPVAGPWRNCDGGGGGGSGGGGDCGNAELLITNQCCPSQRFEPNLWHGGTRWPRAKAALFHRPNCRLL